jgi:hypothetical protein
VIPDTAARARASSSAAPLPDEQWSNVMSDERLNFMWCAGVVSTAAIAVAMTVFLLMAAFSPEITVDVPGIGRCRGSACASGGD